mmetsp:Transcript_8426/g.10373  ORF Transcript_8426/g.10373 Transcript_8426/m.10373 type:complete len:85 (+) Transcript_8426:229-483(+)
MTNIPTQTIKHTADSHTQTISSIQTSSSQTDITSSSITSTYNEIQELNISLHHYKEKNVKLHTLATKLMKQPLRCYDTVEPGTK